MIGGYIIDEYGIIVNFSFTVLMQILLATLPLLLIMNKIPDEKDSANMKALKDDIIEMTKLFYHSVFAIPHCFSSLSKRWCRSDDASSNAT